MPKELFFQGRQKPSTNITQGAEGSRLTAMGFICSVPETAEEIQEPIVYTIKEGDTLTKISWEHNNIPVEIIGDNPNLIKPGQGLLIIYWGPVEASHDFVYKRMMEMVKRGKQITWVFFALNKGTTVQEVADFFDIEAQSLAKVNEISNLSTNFPRDYYLMIPIEGGFAFTDNDREAGGVTTNTGNFPRSNLVGESDRRKECWSLLS